jgi:serine O-acetyltransferase
MSICDDTKDFDSEPYLADFLASFDRTGRSKANFHGLNPLPSMFAIGEIADELMELMFPGRCGRADRSQSLEQVVGEHLSDFSGRLNQQIYLALRYENLQELPDREASIVYAGQAENALDALLKELPTIRRQLKLDAAAGFAGDPAARNVHEIILSYPCMKTLSIHRVAHFLFKEGIPLIPRMLNERMHRETGIDIHPGAEIGESFFIDHGTGVVIGETAVIGNNVKLYQGVTLGALSFPKDACGALIRGAKRHPTIQDNVTIYAHATILGDITVGRNAIIGSNVWIKESIPEDTMVVMEEPKTVYRDLRRRKAQ